VECEREGVGALTHRQTRRICDVFVCVLARMGEWYGYGGKKIAEVAEVL
jgi:hypothetical protein